MEETKILGLRATQKVKINGPDYTGTKKSSSLSPLYTLEARYHD